MTLAEYVMEHTDRGECQCGRCCDKGDKPDPIGHTVDTGFFKVSLRQSPKREDFERLVRDHSGEFAQIDMFAHGIHDYMQVGAWMGDQGLGMQCMALGHLLGCWELVSKAGHGCLTISGVAQRA